MRSLTEYMRKELIFYIKQEYDRGVALSQIRNSLKKGGHHQNLIKEAMSVLKKHDYNLVKALNEPIRSDLDKELYFNILNSLMRYAEFQIAEGRPEKEVKKILSDYGHSEEIIEKALKGAKNQIPDVDEGIKRIDIGYVIVFIILLVLTAGGARESFYLVFGAFLPSILTISILNLLSGSDVNAKMMWIYAPFFSFLFFISGEAGILEMEYEFFNLFVLNFIISIVYTYIKARRTADTQAYLKKMQEATATESDVEADKKDNKKNSKSRKKKT